MREGVSSREDIEEGRHLDEGRHLNGGRHLIEGGKTHLSASFSPQSTVGGSRALSFRPVGAALIDEFVQGC